MTIERKVEEIMITESQLQRRVKELGAQIREDYKGKNLLMVCVLNGSIIFFADLYREVALEDSEIDTIGISSYNGDTESSRNPRITKDFSRNVQGRHVLVVEDIVDTGFSVAAILDILSARGALSAEVCSMTSKTERREIDVPVKYIGFEIPNKWAEGYGMDSDQKGRYRRNIVAIKT